MLAIEPFGSTVHVRFDPQLVARAEIEQALAAVLSSIPRFEPADVSLEDVFLAAVASGSTLPLQGAGHPLATNAAGEPAP